MAEQSLKLVVDVVKGAAGASTATEGKAVVEGVAKMGKEIKDSLTSTVEKLSRALTSGPSGFAASLLSMKSVMIAAIALPIIAASQSLQNMLQGLLNVLILILRPIGDFIALMLRPLVALMLPLVVMLNRLLQPVFNQIAKGQSEAMKKGDWLGALLAVVIEPLKMALRGQLEALAVLFGELLMGAWLVGKLSFIKVTIAAGIAFIGQAIAGVLTTIGLGSLVTSVSAAIASLGVAVAAAVGAGNAIITSAIGVASLAVKAAVTGLGAAISGTILGIPVATVLGAAGIVLAITGLGYLLWSEVEKIKAQTAQFFNRLSAYTKATAEQGMLPMAQAIQPYVNLDTGLPSAPAMGVTALDQASVSSVLPTLRSMMYDENWTPPSSSSASNIFNVTVQGSVITDEEFIKRAEEGLRKAMSMNYTYGGGGYS